MTKEKKPLMREAAWRLLSEYAGYCLSSVEPTEPVVLPLSDFILFLTVRGYNTEPDFSLPALVNSRYVNVGDVDPATGCVVEWIFDLRQSSSPTTDYTLVISDPASYFDHDAAPRKIDRPPLP